MKAALFGEARLGGGGAIVALREDKGQQHQGGMEASLHLLGPILPIPSPTLPRKLPTRAKKKLGTSKAGWVQIADIKTTRKRG